MSVRELIRRSFPPLRSRRSWIGGYVANCQRGRLTVAYTLGNVNDAEYERQDMELKRALGRLRIPELDEAVAAGEILADVRKLWERADESERYELLRGMVASIQADLLSGRIVGVTPKPAFWTLFESPRVDSSKVLLLKPDEVKRWLAERATADLVMVETGEAPSPVTLHSSFVLPHDLHPGWRAYSLGWRREAG